MDAYDQGWMAYTRGDPDDEAMSDAWRQGWSDSQDWCELFDREPIDRD